MSLGKKTLSQIWNDIVDAGDVWGDIFAVFVFWIGPRAFVYDFLGSMIVLKI